MSSLGAEYQFSCQGSTSSRAENPFRKLADGCHNARRRRDVGPQQGEDAVTRRTVTLNDSEYREVAAALELMIDHCDTFVANGPADSFCVGRTNCQAILQKRRSAGS